MAPVKSLWSYIKQNIILLLLSVSIAVSAISYFVLRKVGDEEARNTGWLVHTYEVLRDTEQLLSLLKDGETGQRGYILMGEESYLEPYHASVEKVREKLAALKGMTSDQDLQQDRLDEISALINKKYDELAETIALKSTSDSTSLAEAMQIIASGKGKEIMDELRTAIAEFQETEMKFLASRDERLQSTSRIGRIVLVVSILCSIIIALLGIRSIDAQIKARKKLFTGLEKNNRELLFDHGDDTMDITENRAVENLITNLHNARTFIQSVGKQEYDMEYIGMTAENRELNNDNLAGAMVEMRNQMKQVSMEENKRNWANQGVAKFADLLRKNTGDIQELYFELVRNLVKYINANQAGLFIVKDEDKKQGSLALAACYAYGRKKFLEKTVLFGEGLLGTAVLEREIIYMTKVPSDYIRITSGLGDAPPSCLLISPLVFNDVVMGVIEIASFHRFEEHEIDFIKNLSESIASTISSIKVSEQTNTLLESTQQQAETLKAQEEELRQNLEEISATQEQMHRKEKEYVKRIEELEGTLQDA